MIKLLSFLGWSVIYLIGRTMRIREVNTKPLWKNGSVVFGFFHGEQFIPCYYHRNQKVVIMSSLSKDGEIQAGILSRLGYEMVRGSSSKGGERALVEAIRLARKGFSTAFAVDGPRGPFHQVKQGIIYLAQRAGKPIIPVSSSAKKSIIFKKAWDKYHLPMPFTKAMIVYGEPIYVNKDDNIDEKSILLQNAIEDLSVFANEYYWTDNISEYLLRHPKPKILIIQPSRIGDVIFSLPVLSALRKKYPKAWIGWIVDERCAAILEGNKLIDEVIVFDRKKASIPYIIQFCKYLRSKNIDLSIDLHGLFKSAFLVFLAGARYRIASASTRGMKELSWLFSKEVKPRKEEMHCVERHLVAAGYIGCSNENIDYPIGIGETEKASIKDILKQKNVSYEKPLVVVHPGGGWISRRWFPERFAGLIERIMSDAKSQVILVGGKEGGKSEVGLNQEIKSQIKYPVIDLTGELNLKELMALLSLCTVFVGNEAGPMHIAVALNIPVVALLGPTDPNRTGPYKGRVRIVRHPVECQPCRKRSCSKRDCMKLISVDEVFDAVSEIIDGHVVVRDS